MVPFSDVGREVWLRFENIGEYRSQKEYITTLCRLENGAYKGSDSIVAYLADTKQKKYMKPEFNINITPKLENMLKQRFGRENVAVTVRKVF